VPDYRREVAAARRKRDRKIERASAEARAAIARAALERDAEIRRLRAEGYARPAIAPMVGCSVATMYEVLRADKRAEYNARRRQHHHLRAVA
jgi:DNA invertase Pin-like site-specific DNA recombinase